jgi:hypothetical protein
MRNRILLLGLALAPSLAAAQITINESNDTDFIVNIDECLGTSVSDNLSFQWNFPGFTAGAGGTYTLVASDTANCPEPTNSQAVRKVTIGSVAATTNTGTWPPTSSSPVVVSQLLPQLGIPGTCNTATQNVSICVFLSGVTSPLTQLLTLDLLLPPKPQITSVSPGDSSLGVTWNRGSGGTTDAGSAGASDSFKITATNAANPNETHTTDFISGSPTSGRIDGLTNGVAYNVTVQAFSPGRNPSPASDALTGTPVPVNDFWRLYRNAGGHESGGCATGAAGMLALLTVPLGLRTWRRRS